MLSHLHRSQGDHLLTLLFSLLEMLRDEEVVIRGYVRAGGVEMYESEAWKQVRARGVEICTRLNIVETRNM